MDRSSSPPVRAILHVDMDAFYASVEQRDQPALRGKPVIVGGHPTRGVVLAASYEARPFGVRSALPMSRAVKLAPHAIVVPPRFDAYSDASDTVFSIFEKYTPLVEPLSLDEAFLDVTASTRLFGRRGKSRGGFVPRFAHRLTCPPAGIAAVKFVAKVASDVAKPNGQHEVSAENTIAFLAPLPVSRLWGVGPKTEEELKRKGIHRIGDLAAHDPMRLEKLLGSSGRHWWELAHGIDPRPVIPDAAAKSVGAEDTFEEDLSELELVRPYVHAQALRVGRRLRRAKIRGRVVQLKLKRADFTVLTRRRTLDQPTDDGQTLYRIAEALLHEALDSHPIRLTGVSVQDLEQEAQLGLFQEPPGRNDRLNQALDKIADRFGVAAVTTADLTQDGSELEDDPRERRDRRN